MAHIAFAFRYRPHRVARIRYDISVGVIISLVCFSPCFAFPPNKPENRTTDSDDRLSNDDLRLIAELTARQMPELVEELLINKPRMFQAHVARAFARAGIESMDVALREKFCSKASSTYQHLLELRNDKAWFKGDSRRLEAAQWYVEYSDLVLRHQAATDLDRFEITSGLDFDRIRLTTNLEKAYESLEAAKGLIDDLLVSLRTDEERFMLLGISDKIKETAERRQLNAAWTSLYLAMLQNDKRPNHARLIDTALADFDEVSRGSQGPELKYNALIGAGMALREGTRYEEASAAFDRVIASTAAPSITIRARYEKAKTFIASGQFEAGRKLLSTITDSGKKEHFDAGESFYTRIVPLINANSFILESHSRVKESPESERLLRTARSAFERIALQGGTWNEIASVYLRACGGGLKNPAEMSEADLDIAAARALGEENYSDARRLYEILKQKSAGLSAQDRFNLAVCFFQTGVLREAAEEFASIGNISSAGELHLKSLQYAFICRRRIAGESHSREDVVALARAADAYVQGGPVNGLTIEANWIGALAYQEVGDFAAALRSFERIPAASPNYWPARQRAAECARRIFESLPKTISEQKRSESARKTVDMLELFAKDVVAANASTPDGATRQSWANEARLQAATILTGDDIREFTHALAILETLPPTAAVMIQRLTCLRGMGDNEGARRAMTDFLKIAEEAEIGPILAKLATDQEAQAVRLSATGRMADARRIAADSAATCEQLLDWTLRRKDQSNQAATVRLSLARVLRIAGRASDAMVHLEKVMTDDPSDGGALYAAAQLQEEIADASASKEKDVAADKAESLWSRLLEDNALRESAPAIYWEARFRWLAHRLRHGDSATVIKAVESERAWYPDLGGPPWQSRLLELADKARASSGGVGP